MKNKRLMGIFIVVTILLLIPLIAMQFTNEVVWELNDFVAAGVLLYGTGFLIDLAIRKVKNKENRIALCVAILLVLALIWVELAVGIFGSPFAGS